MGFWESVGRVVTLADLVGIFVAAIAAFQAWKLRQETKQEQERLGQMIPLALRENGVANPREIELHEIRRKDLTRAELLGLIGMVPMARPGRFKLEYISKTAFFDQLEHYQKSDDCSTWFLDCSTDEMDQFDHSMIEQAVQDS